MFFFNSILTLGVVRTGLGEVALLLADEARGEGEGVLALALRVGARLGGVLRGAALEAQRLRGGAAGAAAAAAQRGLGAVRQQVAGLPGIDGGREWKLLQNH